MEMADKPKLTEEKMEFDHANEFQSTTQKSGDDDSFVIDMDNFPNTTRDATANSRKITLQRTLSRKGSQRIGSEKKIAAGIGSAISSSKGFTTPEKAVASIAVGPDDIGSSQPSQVHHQITSSNIMVASTVWESKLGLRRNGLKRSAYICAVDPKRVLLFFATLSSMGTILLIYFTLLIGKFYVNDQALE